eukprot:4234605-Amphidinium_carterae.1
MSILEVTVVTLKYGEATMRLAVTPGEAINDMYKVPIGTRFKLDPASIEVQDEDGTVHAKWGTHAVYMVRGAPPIAQ